MEDCRKKGFKTFNNECLEECPENTYEKNNDNICYCSFFFYKDFQTNLYECLLETEICEEKAHDYKIVNEKQCFDSLEDCRRKGFKTFNNECYSTCPENTNEKNNDGICYCSHFYYNNLGTNSYNCFEENEECVSKGYNYKIDDIKECFTSLEDCKIKGYKIFNNECYSTCPENTKIEENDNSKCFCKDY